MSQLIIFFTLFSFLSLSGSQSLWVVTGALLCVLPCCLLPSYEFPSSKRMWFSPEIRYTFIYINHALLHQIFPLRLVISFFTRAFPNNFLSICRIPWRPIAFLRYLIRCLLILMCFCCVFVCGVSFLFGQKSENFMSFFFERKINEW